MQVSTPARAAPETSLLAAIPGNLSGDISVSASSFHQSDNNFADVIDLELQASLHHSIEIGPSGTLWVSLLDIDSDRDIARQGASRTDMSFVTGPQFTTSQTGYLRAITPYVEGEWVRADTHTLYQSLGAGVVSSGFAGQNENVEWYIDADILERKHNVSARAPFADEENGPNFHIETQITLSANQDTSLILKAEFERQWAGQEFQSYLDTAATVTVVHSFQSPLRGDDYWSVDISGASDYRRYDIPDPFTFPDLRDKSTELSLAATLTIPVSNHLSAFTSLTKYWGKSALPGNDYRRTEIEAGFSYSF